MEQLPDAVSQQIQLLTDRLNEVLSTGLEWLRSEFRVDLGLKPERIPPWVVLFAACSGLVLLVALWASVCRAVFKKRISSADDGTDGRLTTSKPVRSEEPKKKKRKVEKKAQPNGRTVAEPQEEAWIVSEKLVPHHQPSPADLKTEKVSETKKAKKKAKQAVKDTKLVTGDGKEPEEGTWETKVSNKEKREQRKKDKSSSDDSASPGGGATPVSTPPEQPKAPAALPPPASQKKRKGESTKVKAEKPGALVSPVNSKEAAEVVASAPNKAVNVTPNTVAPNTSSWTTQRQAAPLWSAGIDDSWTVIDRPMPSTNLGLVSLGGLGVEPLPVSKLPWLGQTRVDDEWSGLNGSSADPSSDWNAPSEAWGNYEEPTLNAVVGQELPPPKPAKDNLIRAAEDDEDDKDKGDTTADGAAKTKKKKKKKKKAAEEGETAGQVEDPVMETPPAVEFSGVNTKERERVELQVKDSISQKPPVTQVPQKPADGENNLSAPAQRKKPEESQAAKPAKKKKARKET